VAMRRADERHIATAPAHPALLSTRALVTLVEVISSLGSRLLMTEIARTV